MNKQQYILFAILLAIVLYGVQGKAVPSKALRHAQVGDKCDPVRGGLDCPDYSDCNPDTKRCEDLFATQSKVRKLNGVKAACVPSKVKVRLISLHCWITEDNTGADEVYMKIKGVRFFTLPSSGVKKLNNNQDWNINLEFEMTNLATVEVYDEDSGIFWDRDDLIGRHTFSSNDFEKGPQYVRFDGHGSSYQLVYEVVKI